MSLNRTLWIVGTSVSIEDGGYVTHLQRRLPPGFSLTNLSVGDQSSVMGCMRALDCLGRIRRGDVVVWEYSLLDTLLTEEIFDVEDVHAARRLAWTVILKKGASVVVLLTAPRKHLSSRSECEARILGDAQRLGLARIDTRDLFNALAIEHPHDHYRDDRHPLTDSPIVAAMADAVRDAVSAPQFDPSAWRLWQKAQRRVRWTWISARTLATRCNLWSSTYENSLMKIEAAELSETASISLPKNYARIIGIGCVSTHRSGALWCGHEGCPVTSVRLPRVLPYSFLLRTTALSCRSRPSTVRAATQDAFSNGVWRDYGQDECHAPEHVAIFGMLLEMKSGFAAIFQDVVQSIRGLFVRLTSLRRKG